MSVSDDIRSAVHGGASVTEIAHQLGIRYQHVYNVLKADGMLPPATRHGAVAKPSQAIVLKPQLSVGELIRAGFAFSGRWTLSSEGDLKIDRPMPTAVGVYAFSKNGIVLYVGLATMGLAKRLYFYGKPGSTQRTNQRINDIIKNELLTAAIEIHTATPDDFEWNGLPSDGSAGLELGLIKKYTLPWNMRSTG